MIGCPWIVPGDAGRRSTAAGRPVAVASGAIAAGAAVQLVGKVGDDPAGDALLLALSDAGIGHVAVLRDPARATPVAAPPVVDIEPMLPGDEFEPPETAAPAGAAGANGPLPAIDAGDLDLALRYLPDHRVVVVAEPIGLDALQAVAADCSYVGAALIVVVEAGHVTPDLPRDATAIEAPEADPDGVFGRTVGRFAAALDQGIPGPAALAQATSGAGWQATPA